MSIVRFFLLIFFTLQLSLIFGQEVISFKDSIVTNEHLISYKDTLTSNGDTLILRKEIWIKERDSIFLPIDTVSFSDGLRVIFPGDSILINRLKDTIIVIQDTIISMNQRVLRQVKKFTERKTWWAGLLRNLILFEDTKPKEQDFKLQAAQQTEIRYDPFEGKIIRNINIRVLDVFGAKINDPNKRPKGLIEKSGNILHIRTHRSIVRNRLLFKSGERVSALNVAESERILRDNNFIYDARILIRDTLCNSDSIDVDVVVQDVWSIGGAFGADPKSTTMSLTESNFLGLGQQVRYAMRFDSRLPKGYNYNLNYYINNISKTFLTAEFYYRFDIGQTYYGGGLNREFFSPAIKWAGGSNINFATFDYRTYDAKGNIVSSQVVRNRNSDAWLGYGWNVFENSYFKGTRLILSGRVVNSYFSQKPIVPDSIIPAVYDSWLYLSSIGIVGKKFYRDSYIARLGRTEDVPEGYLIALTGGYEQRMYGNRPYYALSTAFSRYYRKGYFYFGINAGAFSFKNQWQQGVLSFRGLYFTPLIKLGRWRMRQYIGSRYVDGIGQTPGTRLNLNNEQGLRGFRSDLLFGTKKWVINFELDLFPPLNVLDFRAAVVLFTDLTWISLNQKLVSKENFYPGYGVGLRFRNDHLIFSIAQINIGYFPNNSIFGKTDFYYFERSNFFYNYYNIQFNRPSLLPFN